mgnify:CR=1 FL=1
MAGGKAIPTWVKMVATNTFTLIEFNFPARIIGLETAAACVGNMVLIGPDTSNMVAPVCTCGYSDQQEVLPED